jgi:hypothetical protein
MVSIGSVIGLRAIGWNLRRHLGVDATFV